MRLHHTLANLTALLALSASSSCDVNQDQFRSKEVALVDTTVPTLAAIDIPDAEKFLNDLKLSPYWKVERDRDGRFVAKARSIGPEQSFGDAASQFLFDFMEADSPALEELTIRNDYLHGDAVFSSFSAMVTFHRPPKSDVTFAEGDKKVSLPVYESYDAKIGPNSMSQLAVRLSSKHDIYLVVFEQGEDIKRATTWKKLPLTMDHLKSVAALPKQYLNTEQYADLYQMLFRDAKAEYRVQRFPGIQDRDTFYGYVTPEKDFELEGINIKISHPVYCNGECTRKSSRMRKAEFLGVPSDRESDRLFFLIEDNAVYLRAPHDKDFGIFSGTKSFEGILEIIDGGGKTIITTKDQFKGWEH